MSLFERYVDIVRKRKKARRGIKLKDEKKTEYVTEEELREESAAVQDAWEKYQMLLKLQAGDRKIGKPKPRRTRPLPR